MPSNHLIFYRPLLLSPLIVPRIRVFSNESALRIRWPKYWSFSFSISPSNEHSGLISFMMDWLDLLAVQGTLKSLLQHYGSKASILRCSAFFIVQLSHPYVTTGKTIALTRWIFVNKARSLLFNIMLTLKKNCLFGCTRSHLVVALGIFTGSCGISGCGARAQLTSSMWDLVPLARDQTCIPCIARQILNQWTIREVPVVTLLSHSAKGRKALALLLVLILWLSRVIRIGRDAGGIKGSSISP